MKWNVYIGRKKERPLSGKNSDADHGSRADGNRANDSREHRSRDFREKRDMTDRRGNNRRPHRYIKTAPGRSKTAVLFLFKK